MLPFTLLPSMLLQVAHIHLRAFCFGPSLPAKATPLCVSTDLESNDALHGQLDDNILLPTAQCHR
jgi:hypothetical protein